MCESSCARASLAAIGRAPGLTSRSVCMKTLWIGLCRTLRMTVMANTEMTPIEPRTPLCIDCRTALPLRRMSSDTCALRNAQVLALHPNGIYDVCLVAS